MLGGSGGNGLGGGLGSVPWDGRLARFRDGDGGPLSLRRASADRRFASRSLRTRFNEVAIPRLWAYRAAGADGTSDGDPAAADNIAANFRPDFLVAHFRNLLIFAAALS